MDDEGSREGSNMATGGGGNPAIGEGVRRSKAVLPVAILGAVDFDVTQIDAGAVTLAGVSALRWNWGDVSTPIGDGACECDCNDYGPDGFLDMKLKFNKAEIVAALGEVGDGDEIPLTITGVLLDGSPFEGIDCVTIRGGGTGATPGGGDLIDDDPATAVASNSPNPFNPKATITFTLAEASLVRLDVYNIAGQKIETIAEGFYQAGRHTCEWDGSSFASGIYLYRIEAGELLVTKKMVLMK